jgi:hypothetical protein
LTKTRNQFVEVCGSLHRETVQALFFSQEKIRRIVHRPDGGITLEQKQKNRAARRRSSLLIVRGLAQNALEVMLTMQSFNRLNRRLMRIGSSVEVLGDAGKDAQRHRLVSIACSRCGVGTEWRPDQKTMRLSDLVRRCGKNRVTGKRIGPPLSCGCLQREAQVKYLRSRKRSPRPTERHWTSFWTQFDDSTLPPLLLCWRVIREGYQFYASVPNRAPVVAKAA